MTLYPFKTRVGRWTKLINKLVYHQDLQTKWKRPFVRGKILRQIRSLEKVKFQQKSFSTCVAVQFYPPQKECNEEFCWKIPGSMTKIEKLKK